MVVNPEKTKVCYVLCYKFPDYIRTQILTAALADINDVELIEVINRRRGVLRYVEVPVKLMKARLKFKPDIFIIGFRGQDAFPLIYPAMAGKPKIFDESVNMHDWLVNKSQKLKENSWIIKLLDYYMKWLFSRCSFILTVTPEEAEITRKIHKLPWNKVKPLYIGANEELSYPRPMPNHKKAFEIFFFGNINPTTGIQYMLDAFRIVFHSEEAKNIHLTFAGGAGNSLAVKTMRNFIEYSPRPENIKYIEWLNFKEIPAYIANADLCLGGPFGMTGQAGRTISTKTYQFIAMAKPTIVGDNKSHRDFIDKKNCLRAKRGNPDSLANAMLWAYRNQYKLPAIGKAARLLYERRFSKKIIAAELEKIIQEALLGEK